jgi:glycyl-tRNA synthetase beta chain
VPRDDKNRRCDPTHSLNACSFARIITVLTMSDFLLEIGCEEIPARMIDAAAFELRVRLTELLGRERLSPDNVTGSQSPRRLAVLATGVPRAQPDATKMLMGPSVSVAFKDGHPSAAAHAFAKKVGVDVSALEKVKTPKGDYLAATMAHKGRSAKDILAEMLPKEISSLPWPKAMYWRNPSERFVRPLRWLVAMLDDELIPLEFDGLRAGKVSRGHRIIGQPEFEISKASGYTEALRNAHVLDAPERLQQIRKALDAATRTVGGARWREDRLLLDTVVNLTEWPSVILGNFDPEFIVLPQEVLVTVMRDHQKYFAVEDADGKLLPYFLAVLNTDGDPQGVIQHGHERVLRARFNDARFFWETDQKYPLRKRLQWLKSVTFQKDLGNYYDKTIRVQRLASWMCELLRASGTEVRAGIVHKAACLAKADLTTELVKEFTELQGIVGGLYARVQQLDPDMGESNRLTIANTIYDHYKPQSMEDSVPRTVESAVLSIADKTDTISGMFALGLQPTGSKDPFALRRQANGIVKTIAEHKFSLSLERLFRDARQMYRGSLAEKKFSNSEYVSAIRDFFRERLEFYLRDIMGFKYDVVGAVLAVGSDDVRDAIARGHAVSKVRGSEDFESISVAFKRIKNILRQASETRKTIGKAVDPQTLSEDAEKELATQIPQISREVEPLQRSREYEAALLKMANIRPTLDKFFDKVMVMVDDEQVRANRLALLQTMLKEFSTIADFSEIVTAGATAAGARPL